MPRGVVVDERVRYEGRMDALTVTPESTALLIVDVQEKLMPAMPEFERRRRFLAERRSR